MYILIVLATMTNLGSYPTQARCEAAVRQIYAQQLDPYNMLEPAVKRNLVAIRMKYNAPREYRCQKV
jgi:hypothetical protein